MAVVASFSNYGLNYFPNYYEWPPLHARDSDPALQDTMLAGNDSFPITNSVYCRAEQLQNGVVADSQNTHSGSHRTESLVTVCHLRSASACEAIINKPLDGRVKCTAATSHPLNEEPVGELTEALIPLESLHAMSGHLEEVRVDYNIEKNVSGDMNKTTTKSTCIKKKKRLKKLRYKSMNKWKPYNNTDLGFHVSPVFCLTDTSDNIDTHQTDNDSDEDHVTISSEKGADIADSFVTNSHSSVQDDIDFFLELGIDVLHGNDQERDDFYDWDGVCFHTLEYSSCLVLDNKPTPPNIKRPVRSASAKDGQTSKPNKASPRSNGPRLPNELHCSPAQPVDVSGIKKYDKYKLFELECSSTKRIYIRRDRHRRKEKAHKSVKSKNCRCIFNNPGRKRRYMHHRLVKMHNIDLDFRGSIKCYGIPAMPKSTVATDVAKEVFRADRKARVHDAPQTAPVQNLNHALHETNCAAGIDGDLATFLISLQHRDMTPEDYDMLLRLDDTVKPKTLSQRVLQKLRTEQIGSDGPQQESSDWEPLCTICMEPYLAGQERKFLPCGHDFHTECIDKWLQNSSMNCPLDGLPVDTS